MNTRQKAFLKSLLKNIEAAQRIRENTVQILGIGGADREACVAQVKELDSYINAARRMVMKYTAAHGKDSKIIAAEAIANHDEN